MSHVVAFFTFPLRLRTHYINFLFLTLLIRSGIHILADHPRLYWNKHCTPGSEWIKFSKNVIPKDKLWTSMDEAVNVSHWIALPDGRHNLGIGRHWHFFAVAFWVLNELVYIAFLFGTVRRADAEPSATSKQHRWRPYRSQHLVTGCPTNSPS